MLRKYHGYKDWKIMKLETDVLTDEYTFGIELEVQKGISETSIETMSDILEEAFGNLFVYEKDGSIGEGFEIISQPMTWNYFKANLNKFKKMFDLLNSENYRSHNGNACGLHVHIGKQGLGLSSAERQELENYCWNDVEFAHNERIGDVVTNINIQLERFRDEIHKFSRRQQQQVDRWCSYLDCDVLLDNGQRFINKYYIRANTKPQVIRGRNGNRYKALNLTNKETVELRLFRGTLKWTTFYYTMNLVNNLIFNAKLESTVVEWKDIAFKGLSNRDKSLCKSYCIERNIELDRNKVVALNYSKKINKPTNKQALLEFIMMDEFA